jgi:hypothetical protein
MNHEIEDFYRSEWGKQRKSDRFLVKVVIAAIVLTAVILTAGHYTLKAVEHMDAIATSTYAECFAGDNCFFYNGEYIGSTLDNPPTRNDNEYWRDYCNTFREKCK